VFVDTLSYKERSSVGQCVDEESATAEAEERPDVARSAKRVQKSSGLSEPPRLRRTDSFDTRASTGRHSACGGPFGQGARPTSEWIADGSRASPHEWWATERRGKGPTRCGRWLVALGSSGHRPAAKSGSN